MRLGAAYLKYKVNYISCFPAAAVAFVAKNLSLSSFFYLVKFLFYTYTKNRHKKSVSDYSDTLLNLNYLLKTDLTLVNELFAVFVDACPKVLLH